MKPSPPMPCPGLREDNPSAWAVVDLPTVARHVLVVRRRRLCSALVAVEGGMRGRRDRLTRDWRRLRRELREHLARERVWMQRAPVPALQVATAACEHESLQDRFTDWRARLEAEGGERWCSLRVSVRRLGRELEEQVYCEQVLLFPRLRAFRAALASGRGAPSP